MNTPPYRIEYAGYAESTYHIVDNETNYVVASVDPWLCAPGRCPRKAAEDLMARLMAYPGTEDDYAKDTLRHYPTA